MEHINLWALMPIKSFDAGEDVGLEPPNRLSAAHFKSCGRCRKALSFVEKPVAVMRRGQECFWKTARKAKEKGALCGIAGLPSGYDFPKGLCLAG